MAKNIANVVIATDSFATWVSVTNQTADAFTRNALTANAAPGGATVTGNSHLFGIFAANTIAANNSLRGGNVSHSSLLTVSSNTNFTGEVINSAANVYIGAANVHVNTTNFVVLGVSTLTGNATFKINATNTNIQLLGNTTASNLTFSVNAVSIVGNVSITNATSVANTVAVTGAATFSNTIAVTNNATFSNTIAVTGNATFSNTVAVTGAATLSNTVAVTGAATFSNTIAVTNNATFSNTIAVTGNATLSNTLGVTGAATLSNTIAVTGAATLSNTIAVTGAATFSNTIAVTNNATFSNTVAVTGAATLSNTVAVTGAATLSNTIAVTGAATFSNTLSTGGNVTLQTDVVFAVYANTNIGNANTSGAFTPVEIVSFTKNVYTGGKFTVKSQNGGNTLVQEILFAHSDSANDVTLTAYGTIAAPLTSNVGSISATINTTAVSIRYLQTSSNTSVKLLAQFIK